MKLWAVILSGLIVGAAIGTAYAHLDDPQPSAEPTTGHSDPAGRVVTSDQGASSQRTHAGHLTEATVPPLTAGNVACSGRFACELQLRTISTVTASCSQPCTVHVGDAVVDEPVRLTAGTYKIDVDPQVAGDLLWQVHVDEPVQGRTVLDHAAVGYDACTPSCTIQVDEPGLVVWQPVRGDAELLIDGEPAPSELAPGTYTASVPEPTTSAWLEVVRS